MNHHRREETIVPDDFEPNPRPPEFDPPDADVDLPPLSDDQWESLYELAEARKQREFEESHYGWMERNAV